tara:strand:- start:738 stop:1532 length:795 start_codon:yes stop_codon:yes gene_type:complete
MFLSKKEKKLNQEYLRNGFVIHNIENIKSLDQIRDIVINIIKKNLPNLKNEKSEKILNNIHNFVESKKLNNFRLEIINKINSNQNFRKNYFEISKNLIETIVGNELAMQLRVGLSVQLPKDSSSLLSVHADTWTGVSPYESVVWLPLVNCYKTKSMYILPAYKAFKISKIFKEKNIRSSEDIYKKIKKDVVWLKVNYGQVVIFDHSLPHGNVINNEKETRWSMNCRFKSIFTPYAEKKIGEYYEPITLRAASKRGITYKYPDEK